MRICIVSQEYPPETARGGIGTQNWNKARTLTRLGHTVHVLSCDQPRGGSDLRTEIHDGVVVHRMRSPGTEPGWEFPVYEPIVYSLGYTWCVLRNLQQLMEKTPFDLIDFAEYGAEGFAFQLNRTQWNWVAVVVQLHGPLAMFSERIGWPEKQSLFAQVGDYMEGISIKQADAVMACSANIAGFTASHYRMPPETIDVVHCGVDNEAFRFARHEPERPTILFVGNIAANKGVTTVIESMFQLRSKYSDILLRILGKGDDEMRQQYQVRARKEGAEANLEFVGFVDRESIPEYYRRAHVFASPASHEVGVANVYLEAMASGCPVVAAQTGGAEAVEDEVSGLLVPPGDVAATTAAFDRLLSDPFFRRRLSEAAHRRVQEYFAMEK